MLLIASLTQEKNYIIVINWWNEIPLSIRKLPKQPFKKKVRNILVEILKKENSYLDLEAISLKIKKIS